MTANLDVRWSRPHFTLDSSKFTDQDMDGVFEPGETVQFFYFMTSDWRSASNAVFKMTSDDPFIKFNVDSVLRVSLAGDGYATNNLDRPIEFVMPNSLIPL